MKLFCPNCRGELKSESMGYKCAECKGLLDVKGVFHKHIEQPFMPPRTNFDRITESVESLAFVLSYSNDCAFCSAKEGKRCYIEKGSKQCIEQIKEWLQKEIEE